MQLSRQSVEVKKMFLMDIKPLGRVNITDSYLKLLNKLLL